MSPRPDKLYTEPGIIFLMSAESFADLIPMARSSSARERIYIDLRGKLQRCELSSNDRLVDVDVASRFGASRMPAREALLQLVNEGYLVGTTRGFMVPILTPDDVRDSFEVRKLLEPRAAANAARDMAEEGQEALRAAAGDARAAADAHDFQKLVLAMIDFRAVWLASVRNARLASTLARFADHVQTVRLATLRDATTQAVAADGLCELCSAFFSRDSISVSDRMATHIAIAEHAYSAMHRSNEAVETMEGARCSS